MAYDRFLIAPYSEGMVTALEPWIIPDEAFQNLSNAYVWRGRVRKRFGGLLMGTGATSTMTAPLLSRLRYQVGVTAGGALAGVVVDGPFNKGSQFSIGDIIFTVCNGAAGANQMYRTDSSAAVATFNLATGAFDIQGTGVVNGTPVYFYPALPVMGVTQYASGAINNHPTLAFDTKWAYEFGNGWDRIGVTENKYWKGDDTKFFWACNWEGVTTATKAMFITNFNVANPDGAPAAADDPMVRYNPTLVPTFLNWTPAYNNAGDIVYTSRVIVPFKDRLVLLNTIEQNAAATLNTAHPNRCRYSHNGSPLDVHAYKEKNNVGFDGGGYIDAPIDEAIVTAEFIKDRLIVYFERSTWELAYTGNQVLPFVWQKINTELGAESTFSVIPFDTTVLGIGNTGVHSCSGANVERIDTKIPNEIFDQIGNEPSDIVRVAGIRDYYVEMAYWTFSANSQTSYNKFPEKILVYNYKTNSWALNDDCITTFGYYEQQLGVTWSQLLMQWQQNTSTWSSGVNAPNFRQIVAGNQEGYTFIVAPDSPMNASVMSLIDIAVAGASLNLTIIDHTLEPGDYIYLNDVQGITGLTGVIFQVQSISDKDTIQIAKPDTYAGTYLGGGNITRVSKVSLLTKQYNPYIDKGRDVYVAKVEFGVLATVAGQITVDYYPSATGLSMIGEGSATGSLLGTNILETYPYPNTIEVNSSRLWHPIYFQSEGECIQMNIYLADTQMRNTNIAFAPFWLEGMVLHTMPTTSRLQ